MFEIVIPIDSLSTSAITDVCLRMFVAQYEQPLPEIQLYHIPVDPKSLVRKIQNRKSFHLQCGEIDFQLASVQNYRLSFIKTEGFISRNDATLLEMVCLAAPLITARLYHSEYEHWQNADDPLEFTAIGRSMEGLSMKSNNLPPPLDQMIIDTSRNPGRRILRDGYVEAIGHRMWLGSEFFRRVPGVRRETVQSTSWLKMVNHDDDILEIIANDDPFIDGSTADLQKRLRQLLFPMTAE